MADKLYLPEGYPAILAEMAEFIRQRLSHETCLEDERVAVLALETAEHVRQQFGGQTPIYIPKGNRYDCSVRDYEIWQRFNGWNYEVLAKEYKLSEMRIRQIVNYVNAHERVKRQGTLF